MAYSIRQQAHIERLFDTIKNNRVPMAVVDYLGRVDADGMVDEQTELNRRFGTRDMRHVAIYDLKVVQRNQAALDQLK